MYLTRVQIKNFRSIENIGIDFDPKCRILVGINESGKTNILDALNLLNTDAQITRRDLREPGLDEDKIAEAYVRFIFKFSVEEADTIIEAVKAVVLSRTYDNHIVEISGVKYTLGEFCKTREAMWVANIQTLKKHTSYWSLSSNSKMLGNWKKVAASCPPGTSILDSGARQ